MLKVSVGNVHRIFNMLSKPNGRGYSGAIIYYGLGQATLHFPLQCVYIKAMSTGEEYEISARIETNENIGENEQGKIHSYKLPIILPPFLLVPDCVVLPIGNLATMQQCFRVLDKENTELYTVYLYKQGYPLVISAGLTQIPSAPIKKLTTVENLEKDLKILAKLIESVVNASYAHNLFNLDQIFTDKKDEDENIKHFYEYLKANLNYALKIDMGLCIHAPISADEVFDSDEDIEVFECENPPPDKHKKEPPPYIGKVHVEIDPKKIKYGLKDVAGIDDQKEQITEILSFIKNPERFTKLGAEIPTGVLLEGPPGTGKTMLAQAVAKEAGIPFFRMDGSAFVQVFVGVGAGRVRELFSEAKEKAPCIIFIDEIDAIAGSRGTSSGSGGEREQALNQLLAEMDGFEENSGVIVMAATNRSDMLDSAILSRFNRKIVIPNPNVDAREEILIVHSKTKPFAHEVNLRKIARSTSGFSGRDLRNLLNESALLATRRCKDKIEEIDIRDAKEKIVLGSEWKIKNRKPEELEGTAYHEAGHALVGEMLRPLTDPIEKITIIPHDHSLGVTVFSPEEDKYRQTKKELLAKLKMGLGGRAAEIIKFGEENVSTGASEDIEQATRTVRKMVKEWGLSRVMGPVNYGSDSRHQYLGYRISSDATLSEKTKENIDKEVKDFLEKMLKKAERILRDNIKALDALAKALLKKETLDGNEARKIIRKNITSTPITQIDDEKDKE